MPYDSWDDESEEDIYSTHVLEHCNRPFHRGHLSSPTHAFEDKNPLCGDVVRIELDLDENGLVRDIYFDGSGCKISQASASMLSKHMHGKSLADIKAFRALDMLELLGVRLTPNRQKCCLLPWKVLQVAVHSPAEEAQGSA